jgi:hypothetical protein
MSRSRIAALICLVVLGLGAAGVVWYSVTHAQVLASTHELASLKVDALVERVARLDAAMQSFQDAPAVDVSWFATASALVNELHTRAAELDAALPGIAMAPRARLAETLQRTRETLDGARANFDAGRALMAYDVVETDGKPAAAALWAELSAIRGATAAELSGVQRMWWQRAAAAIGAWALAWLVGLIWLARRQAPAAVAESRLEEPPAPPEVVEAPALPASPSPTVQAVADLCERIGQARDVSELQSALAQTAAVVQASGLVLWVRDEEALIVGAAHGYPDSVAQRLGRVMLADENLITRAWHTSQCQTSPATAGRRASFAAPLLGATGPVGVLAAELVAGAEPDSVVGPARLIAAQFATMLGETAAVTPPSAGDTPPVAAGSPIQATGS